MADYLILVLIIGAAASYVIHAWLHGSLFAEVIDAIKTDAIQITVTSIHSGRLVGWFADKLAELLLCHQCLSFWVCLTMWLAVGTSFGPLKLIVGTFASAYIAYSTKHMADNLE